MADVVLAAALLATFCCGYAHAQAAGGPETGASKAAADGDSAADLTETVPASEADALLGQVVQQEVRENLSSASIQERIDAIADDTEAMTAEYKASQQTIRQLRVYNRQLEGLMKTQEDEIVSLRSQIDEVTVVGRQIMPHMERMIDVLEKFVELDVPFLLDERRKRVASLRDMLEQADVTISEKYRRILESYQIEGEYGRSIEAYSGSIEVGGASRTVDFLRVGRNALLYQTLDGSESGVWNQSEHEWKKLDPSYRLPIRQGLRIARKQTAPELLEVPLPAPEVLQ